MENDEDHNEITKYKYTSDGYLFEYFVGFEVAAFIGYKNPTNILKNVSKCNQIVFREYPGVKEPEIDPRTILISRDGVNEILIKTHKRISPDVLRILKKFNFDITNCRCLNKEQQENIIKTEKFEDNHKMYSLDFPEYNTIECGENGYDDKKLFKERESINYLNEKIEMEDDEDHNELRTYKYTSGGYLFEYFVGFEVTSLIGYKNTNDVIIKNVSKCNQLVFREYPGDKNPKIDPRTILITRDGVNEIIIKTRKSISPDVIRILKKFNIDTTNCRCLNKEQQANIIKTEKFEDNHKIDSLDFPEYKIYRDENKHSDKKSCNERKYIDYTNEKLEIEDDDFDIEIENELTTYEYISNGYFFEYFVGFEIATLIGYSNPTKVVTKNVSKCNQLVFREYPGVKEPEIDPRTILITRDGAIEILIKTRKRISSDVLHILKKFNIDTTNRKCLTKEQQTLSAITNTFKTEKFEDQYKIGSYYLDLYFPEYKIVVECDENGHADRKPYKERDRMDYVNEKLEMEDDNWIRYNPDEYDFDISKVIGKIYRKIDEIKEEKYKKLLNETKKEPSPEPIYFKKAEWTLQIEPTTGKFTTPPKEFLIEKLKTHNISDIAKSFGCSTKPINRWLKDYDIKIKDFHNLEPPPEDELISHCKTKTQTEVALHYDVSNHIIRKWLKFYNTDFAKIKSQTKTISKEELLKLKNDFTDDEIANQTNSTVLNIKKLIQTHNIDKIPSKEELEKKLHEKSKDELALIYNTTRTTMRKWIRTYGLEKIRYQSTVNNKKISTVDENGSINIFPSIKKLCKVLHISKRKVYELTKSGEFYNGYKYIFIE
jgi:very-short-patch-repair endonuclease/prophage antirepressor-like protein/transposase-like protein